MSRKKVQNSHNNFPISLNSISQSKKYYRKRATVEDYSLKQGIFRNGKSSSYKQNLTLGEHRASINGDLQDLLSYQSKRNPLVFLNSICTKEYKKKLSTTEEVEIATKTNPNTFEISEANETKSKCNTEQLEVIPDSYVTSTNLDRKLIGDNYGTYQLFPSISCQSIFDAPTLAYQKS